MGQFRRSVLGLVALAAGVSLSGCGLVSFDVTQQIPEQTVPGSAIASLLPAGLFEIPVNVDIDQATQGMGTGPAKSVTLTSFSLTVTAPAGATFEFIDSIAIFVAAPSDPSLPKVKIADLPDAPPDATISIPPTGEVNLLPYINAGADITATASGHAPAQDTTFNGQFVLKVSA